jgi:hypothetical protein
MIQKLPRAPAGQTCALEGTVWNRTADAIENFGKIEVAPPLMMSQGPNGPLISIVPSSPLPAGTGKYKVLQLIDNANPGTPGWDFVRFP